MIPQLAHFPVVWLAFFIIVAGVIAVRWLGLHGPRRSAKAGPASEIEWVADDIPVRCADCQALNAPRCGRDRLFAAAFFACGFSFGLSVAALLVAIFAAS